MDILFQFSIPLYRSFFELTWKLYTATTMLSWVVANISSDSVGFVGTSTASLLNQAVFCEGFWFRKKLTSLGPYCQLDLDPTFMILALSLMVRLATSWLSFSGCVDNFLSQLSCSTTILE